MRFSDLLLELLDARDELSWARDAETEFGFSTTEAEKKMEAVKTLLDEWKA